MYLAAFITCRDTALFTCVQCSFTEGLFCPPSQGELAFKVNMVSGAKMLVRDRARMSLSSEFLLCSVPLPPELPVHQVPLAHTPPVFA